MSSKEWLGIISILCATIGYSHYIWSVLRGKNKPHAFSWGVWTLLMTIVFLAQISKGGASGAWVTGYSAVWCFIIVVLALRRGEKNIMRSDWFALIGALATIPVWYFTHNPLGAVVLATIIDALAYFPTYRKSWQRPYEENFFTYIMDDVKWIAALFALGSYSTVTLLYPLFLLLANATLVVMILARRRTVARHS